MRTLKRRFATLTVARLPRLAIYKPLAVLMAILLAPAVSWIESSGSGGAAGPFQAQAQLPVQPVQGCTSNNNSIIQNYCFNGSIYYNDLVQLESDGVNVYLGLHGLPASDAHVIYDYGRQDLRNGVRAAMFQILMAIIQKPASSRTAHEQNVYTLLQGIVQSNEIALYTDALNEYHRFQNDPCTFTLDPDLASALNISYDGTPFCFSIGLPGYSPTAPSVDYFKDYGLKHSYAATAQTDPNYGSIFRDSSISVGTQVGITLGAATLVGGLAGTLFGVAAATATGLVAAGNALLVSATSVAAASGVALGIAAPVLVIVLAVALIGVAAFELYNDQKVTNDINDLNNTLAQVTNTPPDLLGMASDTSGLGMFKLENSVFSQMDPDIPSTAALPSHQSGDLSFAITPQSTGTTAYSNTLQYQDWNGNDWSAQTWGGWLVQTCAQGANSSTACQNTSSITGDLRYVDWSGTKWTASRFKDVFVSTKASPASTDQNCPADSVSGVTLPGGTIQAGFSNCLSYTSAKIPMLDANSNPITVEFSSLGPPFFVDPGALSYSLGTPATVNITAGGTPAANICWDNGLVHAGFDSSIGACHAGSYPLSFDGGLTDPTGTYTLQLTASNSYGTVTQNFTVKVADVLNIVSAPSTLTGIAGTPMNFRVVATGNPTPKLSYNGPSLQGMTFHDNGDGTGTLSGTYTGETLNTQCIIGSCVGFVATNSQGTVTQRVAVNFTAAPSASETPGSVTFVAGIENTAFLTSSGGITPVSWVYQPDPNAPWLRFTDNGNGSGVLSGTPPAGTTGTFEPDLSPHALGTGVELLLPFPVTVVNTPTFITANTATFTVGTDGNFEIKANTGEITTSDTMPQGLTFGSGNHEAKIIGTPAVGSGGQYYIRLDTSSSAGSTAQDLTLNVNEAPSFTSPALVVLFAGQPASVAVNTIGFPTMSTHVVTANSGPPTSPSQGDGTYFTVSGLPTTLAASNLNSFGFATGTLTLSGTPQASDVGTHKVQITAQNGVGNPGQQTLTLQVLPSTLSSSASLLSNWVFSRDANNNVLATVVVTNDGTATAQNVSITAAKIGTVSGIVSPSEVASIASKSTATFEILFPGSTVGGSGTPRVISLSGTYTGGTFNNAGRIVLP